MKQFSEEKSKGPCRIICNDSYQPENAVFINGSLGNIYEMDDIHRTSILHPGPVVIPAALAAAQYTNSNSKSFLKAIVLGYEAMIRIGESVGLDHYKFFHNTASCGPFGATVAAGIIFDLSDDEIIYALGNAGSLSGGFWQMRKENVMTKQLHNAHAARSGYVAAALAKKGMTGPKYILEGSLGFYKAVCPNPNPDRVTKDCEGHWKIFDTSFKIWAACRHAHPAIDAMLKIKKKINSNNISKVIIKTYNDAVLFCDNECPNTILEAKFSLQHVSAICILDGPPNLESFESKNYNRKDIVELRKKIRVESNINYTNLYPNHYGASVEILMNDGESFFSEVSDALGDPDNPIEKEQLINKAKELMLEGGMNLSKVNKIIENTFLLEDGLSLNTLSDLLKL